jgi:hypothetical protein
MYMYEHAGALKRTIDETDFFRWKFVENIEETAWRGKPFMQRIRAGRRMPAGISCKLLKFAIRMAAD